MLNSEQILNGNKIGSNIFLNLYSKRKLTTNTIISHNTILHEIFILKTTTLRGWNLPKTSFKREPQFSLSFLTYECLTTKEKFGLFSSLSHTHNMLHYFFFFSFIIKITNLCFNNSPLFVYFTKT